MKGGRGITKDLVQQKIQERDFKKHQQRIQDIIAKRIKWKMDTQYDKECQTKHLKSKILANRFKFEENQSQITYVNGVLVDRITRIKGENTQYAHKNTQLNTSNVQKSTLHHNYRKKQAFKVAVENNHLIQRLQNPKPVLDNKSLMKDEEKYLKLRKHIQKHDFYPEPYKKVQSMEMINLPQNDQSLLGQNVKTSQNNMSDLKIDNAIREEDEHDHKNNTDYIINRQQQDHQQQQNQDDQHQKQDGEQQKQDDEQKKQDDEQKKQDDEQNQIEDEIKK